MDEGTRDAGTLEDVRQVAARLDHLAKRLDRYGLDAIDADAGEHAAMYDRVASMLRAAGEEVLDAAAALDAGVES